MDQQPEAHKWLPVLFPEAGEELRQLLASAADNADLSHTDFYTIRDLLDLSGYETEQSLHLLLLIMLLALQEGSLCLEVSLAGLGRYLADLADANTAQDWASSIVTDLDQKKFPALIGQSVEEGKPIVALQTEDHTYLYFQKYLKHEQDLVTELKKRLGGEVRRQRTEDRGQRTEDMASILEEVMVGQPPYKDGKAIKLNHSQQLAVGLALLQDFTIISGGPGTGKTSIVGALLRCLVRCGVPPEAIALAAPTGRAAQRLTEALRAGLNSLKQPSAAERRLQEVTAHTLHHLLRYHPGRGTFAHHRENPLLADVVIVDEVSMVGIPLLAQLLQALRPSTRLILLGDKNQLPSVEAGAFLASFVPADTQTSFSPDLRGQLARLLPNLDLAPDLFSWPVSSRLQDVLVVLEENYRSQRDIQKVAQAINDQQLAVVERLPQVNLAALSFAQLAETGGCRLLDIRGSVPSWRAVLQRWADHYYLQTFKTLLQSCLLGGAEIAAGETTLLDQLFDCLARARILTLIREGPWGCVGINSFLEQQLRRPLDPGCRGWQLFNGDVGLTLPGQHGYRVCFQRQSGYVSFPADALPPHELAFAQTVHKSQGSEYDQVMLVLPAEGGRRLLSKEMIYTGLTRARQLAVLCANPAILRQAISRQIVRQAALLQAL